MAQIDEFGGGFAFTKVVLFAAAAANKIGSSTSDSRVLGGLSQG